MQARDTEELARDLALLRRQAQDILARAGEFPALERNGRRLLASLAMMELALGLDPPLPGEQGGRA